MHSEEQQLWRVVAYFEETPFLVAATHPVCPCCGKQLMSRFEFDGGFAAQTADERGPLFDFVRSLR